MTFWLSDVLAIEWLVYVTVFSRFFVHLAHFFACRYAFCRILLDRSCISLLNWKGCECLCLLCQGLKRLPNTRDTCLRHQWAWATSAVFSPHRYPWLMRMMCMVSICTWGGCSCSPPRYSTISSPVVSTHSDNQVKPVWQHSRYHTC